MSFPAEFTLTRVDNVYYLCALPIKEIEGLYDESLRFEDLEIDPTEKKEIPLPTKPCLIKVEAELSSARSIRFTLFGRSIVCDTEKNTVTLSKNTAPLSLTSGKLELVILSDQCSLELYLDGGKFYMGTVNADTYCDYNLPYLEIASNDEVTLDHLEIHSLKSIWR
jgi:hypothetical protein